MKKVQLFAVAMIVMTAAGSLFAGGKSDAGGSAAAAKKSDVTLSMIVSQGWVFPGDDEVNKRFKEKTGITIDVQVIPAAQEQDLVKSRLTSGQGPDMFMVQTSQYMIQGNTIDPEKYLVDMSGESWVNVMSKSRIPAVSYKGKVYGLMRWYASAEFITVYNKTLFKELGIAEPKTFADFTAACEKIKAAGITPVYEQVASGWHHQLPFFQIGPRYEQLRPGLYEGLNNNTIKFADVKEFEQCLNQINTMAQKGYYGKNYMSNDGSDEIESFATRKAAMIWANPSAISQIHQDYPEVKDEFGLFLLRFMDNNTFPTNPNGPALFAYSGSKHIPEIKEYFKFIMTPEMLQVKLDGTPEWTNIDVTVPVTQHYPPEEAAFMATITDAQKNIQEVLQNGTKYTNDQWMEFGADMADMFMGKKTAMDVLKATDERRAKIAKSQGDPNWK